MWKYLRGRRRALLLVPLVLLMVAGSGVWLLTRDDSAAASTTTATVTSQTIEQTVSADGTIGARKSADESFAVSGTVTRVLVDEGDKVTRGQALATVGRSSLVATRTAAVSSLSAAVTQLDEDENNDASDVQIAADEAAIVAARATVTGARVAVEDATLRASIAGTVTSIGVAEGDSVGSVDASSSADSTDTGTSETISIVSIGSYVVDATVAAQDAEQLKKGMQAEITATGVDDTIYGTVSEVGLVAQTNDSGAAVFPVTIEVTGKQKNLYSGVSATASIVVKQIPDVLTVDSRALSTEADKTYVTKLVDGEQVKTAVETGKTYGLSTEITSGLEEGDEVVVATFTAPTGSRNDTQQGGFPGGQLPGFSQMQGQAPQGAGQ